MSFYCCVVTVLINIFFCFHFIFRSSWVLKENSEKLHAQERKEDALAGEELWDRGMGSWWNPQFQLSQALSRSESATAILFNAYNKLFILLLILLHTSGNSIQPGRPYIFKCFLGFQVGERGKNPAVEMKPKTDFPKDIWWCLVIKLVRISINHSSFPYPSSKE